MRLPYLMSEEQVALIHGQGFPRLQVHLNFHLVPANLLNGDQRGSVEVQSWVLERGEALPQGGVSPA